MYLLSIVLHCFVALAVTGAAALESGTFRHPLIALGLGAGAAIALKTISGYSLALMPPQPERETDHERL
jgi:hypothetical protein